MLNQPKGPLLLRSRSRLANLYHSPGLFAGLLTLAFLTLLGIVSLEHEFWRDEMQAWLIGRDSPTLFDVIAQARYEGAPPLWNMVLWCLARITRAPEIMQVTTWLIATVTFFVICLRAPFNRFQKALLLPNYYLLFQYGTVCRNYLPGILAMCVACALTFSKKKRPWTVVILLVCAGMCSAHTLILAAALAVAFWGLPLFAQLRQLRSVCSPLEQNRQLIARNVAYLGVTAAGLLCAIYLTRPQPDTFYAPAHGWFFGWNLDQLTKVCRAFVDSHLTWPRPDGYFWLPPWDAPKPIYEQRWAIPAATLLLISSCLLLLRSSKAFLFYIISSAGLTIFFYCKYLGGSRHTGFFFLTFLFSYWLLKEDISVTKNTSVHKGVKAIGFLISAILCVQAYTGIWAIRQDYLRPFSGGKNAVNWLKDNDLEDMFIAVGPDWAGAPISGYLERPVYYPNDNRIGSFTRWNRSRKDNLDDHLFYQRAMRASEGKETVLIVDHPLSQEFCVTHNIIFKANIGGSLTPFEDYYIYYTIPLPSLH